MQQSTINCDSPEEANALILVAWDSGLFVRSSGSRPQTIVIAGDAQNIREFREKRKAIKAGQPEAVEAGSVSGQEVDAEQDENSLPDAGE